MPGEKKGKMNKYSRIMIWIFKKGYKKGSRRVAFEREDLRRACKALEIPMIRNVGDIPYSFRFRSELPDEIKETAPADCEWIIVGTGTAEYEFRLASPGKISPAGARHPIKIPDATPEIVRKYAPGTDEQALLTRVRYNRLVDVFAGLTCYSIQNHFRTTVQGIGQIEVDEIYLGINKRGTHFVLPCQAKSPGDRFGIVQVMQDMSLCNERYPNTVCRPIALQFLGTDDVAVLELIVTEEDDLFRLNVVDEKHYKFVHRSEISEQELVEMKNVEG